MAMLEFLLAALLDPVQAALVLVIVLAYRGPVPVPAAAVAAAVASETITVFAATDYTWGEMMAPRLLSSLAQAALLCWIVCLIWPSRAAPQHLTGRLSRLAPWHMRAFVKRRLMRLRAR